MYIEVKIFWLYVTEPILFENQLRGQHCCNNDGCCYVTSKAQFSFIFFTEIFANFCSIEWTSLIAAQRKTYPSRCFSQHSPKLQSFWKRGFLSYKKPMCSGLTTEFVLVKTRLSATRPTGAQNNYSLQKARKRLKMHLFKDFFRRGNNRDVVPTLEAMQKMVEVYHNKGIDGVKLGCTLPNRANTCLHNSTSAMFYQFFDSDKHFLSKVFENIVRGPSKVCTSKAVVDETCVRKSTKFCKTIVGIDASRLNPYSLCQPMPEKLYTRYEFDADLQRFKPHQNQSRISENMVMSYFHRMRPDCRIETL